MPSRTRGITPTSRAESPKLLSELLSGRTPNPAKLTTEARNELEKEWARVASIHRPADYESAALTS